VQELRKGKYPKTISSAPDVLQAVVQLNLEVEGSANHSGVMLLPPATVESLLQDKRRPDLLQSFKVAMLKLASQVRSQLLCQLQSASSPDTTKHAIREMRLPADGSCDCCLQEAARLMAAGDYESALPVALEAVTIGEKLFKPQPALQLFPLYLLAAQVGTVGRLSGYHAVTAHRQQHAMVMFAPEALSQTWKVCLEVAVQFALCS
jgi:hypothetical protein